MIGSEWVPFYGGRLATLVHRRLNISPLSLYAAAGAVVAVGAFAVLAACDRCGRFLLGVGAARSLAFLVSTSTAVAIVTRATPEGI